MKKGDEKVENATIVNGAVLTAGALKTIKDFQMNDNGLLDINISEMADAICFLELLCAHEIDADEELVKTARLHIDHLIDIREGLKLLQKP